MRIGPHPRSRNPSIPRQLQQTGDENRLLPGDTTLHRVDTLAGVRVQRQRDRIGSNRTAVFLFVCPNPGTLTFHLTPVSIPSRTV